MNHIIVILILSFSVGSLEAKISCDTKNPIAHAKKHIKAGGGSSMSFKRTKINSDRKKDFLIFNRDSCSSVGCDTAIYLSSSKGCYTYSGTYKGPLVKERGEWFLVRSGLNRALFLDVSQNRLVYRK